MAIQFFGPGYSYGAKTAYTTDNKPGGSMYVGTTTPQNPEVGDIWIDNTTGTV